MKYIKYFLRTIAVIIALVLLAFFIMPMNVRVINIGNIVGIILCVWVICVAITPLHNKIKLFMKRNKLLKYIYYIVNICMIVFIIYGTIITSCMIYSANKTPSQNATAVVLGAQVKNNGPSVILWGRINCAYDYLSKNPNANAVLSGGKGSDEPMSEGQAIYNELVKKGIDKNRLYIEDKSVNTTENIKNSMKIIKDNKLNENIAIVSDGFHQFRTRIITMQQNIKTDVGAVSSDTSQLFLPTYVVREWFAIPNQLLFR